MLENIINLFEDEEQRLPVFIGLALGYALTLFFFSCSVICSLYFWPLSFLVDSIWCFSAASAVVIFDVFFRSQRHELIQQADINARTNLVVFDSFISTFFAAMFMTALFAAIFILAPSVVFPASVIALNFSHFAVLLEPFIPFLYVAIGAAISVKNNILMKEFASATLALLVIVSINLSIKISKGLRFAWHSICSLGRLMLRRNRQVRECFRPRVFDDDFTNLGVSASQEARNRSGSQQRIDESLGVVEAHYDRNITDRASVYGRDDGGDGVTYQLRTTKGCGIEIEESKYGDSASDQSSRVFSPVR